MTRYITVLHTRSVPVCQSDIHAAEKCSTHFTYFLVQPLHRHSELATELVHCHGELATELVHRYGELATELVHRHGELATELVHRHGDLLQSLFIVTVS